MSDEQNNTDMTPIIEQTCEFVDEVLRLAGFEAKSQGSFDGNNLLVKIDGKDSEALVIDENDNYRPEVTDAIADLARRIIDERNAPPIVIDAANRRSRRLEQLEILAEILADEAKDGRKIDVFGLDNVERRTVHRLLAEEDGVESNSDGHSIYRRLTVRPGE